MIKYLVPCGWNGTLGFTCFEFFLFKIHHHPRTAKWLPFGIIGDFSGMGQDASYLRNGKDVGSENRLPGYP